MKRSSKIVERWVVELNDEVSLACGISSAHLLSKPSESWDQIGTDGGADFRYRTPYRSFYFIVFCCNVTVHLVVEGIRSQKGPALANATVEAMTHSHKTKTQKWLGNEKKLKLVANIIRKALCFLIAALSSLIAHDNEQTPWTFFFFTE